MKLLFTLLVTFAFCIFAAGTLEHQQKGYSLSDRQAMDRLVARALKPHGKLAEAEQYRLAVYLWEEK